MFRLPMSLLSVAIASEAPGAIKRLRAPTPYGASKRTVAQDKRAAKRRKAYRRAKRLGHA